MVSYIPKDLLDELQKVFPNKLPDFPPPPEAMGILIGQQKVIAYLLNQYKLQLTNEFYKPKD